MMKSSSLFTLLSAAFFVSSVAYAQYAMDFEAPTFTSGATINGQDSWTSTTPDRGACAYRDPDCRGTDDIGSDPRCHGA